MRSTTSQETYFRAAFDLLAQEGHGGLKLGALCRRLAQITTTFLQVQVDSGVSAIQLFDSWAGALSEADYRRFVLPHSTAVLGAIEGVPRIHFGVDTAARMPRLRELTKRFAEQYAFRSTEPE